MNKKREFLKALVRGDKKAALAYKHELERKEKQDPRSMGDKMRITAFERNGVFTIKGNRFNKAGFQAFVKKISDVENVRVILFRTRNRSRPNT